MKTRIILGTCLLISVMSITGCATIIAQACNPDAAYAAGINDAKNGYNMTYNYAGMCPDNNAAINAAYQAGYSFGFAAVNSGTNINIYTDKHKKPKYLNDASF